MMNRVLLGGLVAAMCYLPACANAQDSAGQPLGPPAEVIAAWENGEGHLLPGRPAWVQQLRPAIAPSQSDRELPQWVSQRHAMAQELGFGGPPHEVIEAWHSGYGFDLPGPPPFIVDLLQAFGRE